MTYSYRYFIRNNEEKKKTFFVVYVMLILPKKNILGKQLLFNKLKKKKTGTVKNKASLTHLKLFNFKLRSKGIIYL